MKKTEGIHINYNTELNFAAELHKAGTDVHVKIWRLREGGTIEVWGLDQIQELEDLLKDINQDAKK